MTIKQQGGIFGRNPTFNDLTVEGTLTTTGSTSYTSLDVDNVNIDGNTVSATDTNGDLTVEANGTGEVKIPSDVELNQGTKGILKLSGDSYKIEGGNNFGDIRMTFPRLRFFEGANLVGQFDSDNLTVNRGNVVIGTSGKGIDFSATSGSGTSELFDDYEEGTFTPAFISSGQSGSWTYTSQVGHYTKVGNRVFGTIQIAWSAKPSVGAQLWIYNLPFSVHADDLTHSGAYITYMTSGSMPNTNFLSVRTDNNHSGNPTGLEFYEAGTDTINVSTGNNVGSSGNINLVFNYRVA